MEFTNPQLVTIAVAQSGGYNQYIDREDIALSVNSLAPGRFNWRKYPEHIDLTTVSDALRDAKKSKYGGLLIGDNSKGWMLSPAGVEWIASINLNALQQDALSKIRRNSISANKEIETARLRTTDAYQLFITGKLERVTINDFFQFARINEYFQIKAREKRYAILDNVVVGDEILSQLWASLKERFSKELN